ncbi:transmembrane protein, putative [Bodo saltans]|uniref:Transmembrane protein, putative n=1 Tax=Bodo saltans TaxID=75058 RepID=A0A0S4J4E5_BODSA|nr:transmembrane protein, putative [Bodo saltans]|eukprot:CUG43135.1 transmembrane protein, putative [Bodo saltans]
MNGDRPTVSSSMGPPSYAPPSTQPRYSTSPMSYQTGRRPSPEQYGRIGGGRVSAYSAPPPMIDPHRTAMHYLRARTKALCFLTGFLGLITFVSFWALYYWPIACAFMLLYLAFVCYREAAGYGSLSSNWAFSRSGLFVGRELIFVVFGLCFLLCLAEVVVGIILCVVLDGATQVIFCAIGAVTGGLSIVAMYLLNRSLKYLEAPVLTMQPSIGPPPLAPVLPR